MSRYKNRAQRPRCKTNRFSHIYWLLHSTSNITSYTCVLFVIKNNICFTFSFFLCQYRIQFNYLYRIGKKEKNIVNSPIFRNFANILSIYTAEARFIWDYLIF